MTFTASLRSIPTRTASPRPIPTRPEREPSDMANEMLMRIIKGLSTNWSLTVRDQQVLYHFLFGRSSELIGRRLGIRETTVHRHLHRIFAKTRTASRRGLIDLGVRLADQRGIPAMRLPSAPAFASLRAA